MVLRLCTLASILLLVLGACQPPSSPDATPRLQQPTLRPGPPYRVAYLWQGRLDDDTTLMQDFRDGLQAHGWQDGLNLTLEIYAANNRVEQLSEIVNAAVASAPDLIVVGSSAAAPLAAQATQTIPIVLTLGGNVVRAGMACAVNRPCGNVTGVSLTLAPLSPKRLEYLKEIAPTVRRVGFLYFAGIPETQLEIDALQSVVSRLDVELVARGFNTPDEIPRTLQDLLAADIDALIIMPDSVSVAHRKVIADTTLEYRLPDAYGVNLAVRDGGLLAYGADRRYNYRRAAFYVDRILRGTPPDTLPIEQPDRFELHLNTARAAQLGIQPPAELLIEATQVWP
jgi:putative tryptophan/tyrosine transport system substrate-binding protein